MSAEIRHITQKSRYAGCHPSRECSAKVAGYNSCVSGREAPGSTFSRYERPYAERRSGPTRSPTHEQQSGARPQLDQAALSPQSSALVQVLSRRVHP